MMTSVVDCKKVDVEVPVDLHSFEKCPSDMWPQTIMVISTTKIAFLICVRSSTHKRIIPFHGYGSHSCCEQVRIQF